MKLKLLFVLLFALLFTGCLDIEEEISFNKKGKGTYSMNIETGEMIEMLKSFGAGDSSMKGMDAFNEKKDSIIEFGKMIDSVAYLTGEEKKLLQPATIRFHIDPDQKQMNMKTEFPFSSFEDFSKIMDALVKVNSHESKNKKEANALPQDNDPMESMFENMMGGSGMGTFSSFTVTKNLVERKMPEDKKEMISRMKDNEQMGGALAMMSSIKFNTIIKLPRKVKKSSGAGIELSKDKKTVTISSNFSEMLSSPESFDFRIEY